MLTKFKINVLVKVLLRTIDKTVRNLQKKIVFLFDFRRVLMTSSTCLHLHSSYVKLQPIEFSLATAKKRYGN